MPQVLDVLQLSRATLRKIQQNMWWAAGYNLIGIPLAAGAPLPLTGLALTPSLSGACVGRQPEQLPCRSCLPEPLRGAGILSCQLLPT